MEHEENINVDDYDVKINFKRNKKDIVIKLTVKVILFILIAAFTGAITALKVLNSKSNEIDDKLKSVTRYFPRGEEKGNPILTKDTVIQVTEKIGASIVAVSADDPDAFAEENKKCSSGIVFDKKGDIITSNYHSLQNLKQLYVKKSGKIYNAKLIGGDTLTDIAVIKVDGLQNLSPVNFSNYDMAKVGQYDVAISNPFDEEYNGNASLGVIYGVNKRLQFSETSLNVLLTDARVNSINGGGVICDTDALVMGMTSLRIADKNSESLIDYEKEGINYALSGEDVNAIAEEIIRYGKITRPSIGIYGVAEIGKNQDDIFSDSILGIKIEEIIPGSGAEKAGIQNGDILEEVNNVKINRIDDVADVLKTQSIGNSVACKIIRQNPVTKETQTMKIDVIVSDLKVK